MINDTITSTTFGHVWCFCNSLRTFLIRACRRAVVCCAVLSSRGDDGCSFSLFSPVSFPRLFPSPNPHFSTAAVSAAAALVPLLPVVVFSSFPKSPNPETPNKYSKNRIFEVLLLLLLLSFCLFYWSCDWEGIRMSSCRSCCSCYRWC